MKNKKIFLVLLLVLALSMFAGCGKKTEVAPDTTNPPTTTEDGITNNIKEDANDLKNDITSPGAVTGPGVTTPNSNNTVNP